MRTFRVPFQLLFLLSLVASIASASSLTLSGNQHFPALDGSAQDADGLANGVFSVDGDLVLDGTIRCNDDAPLSPGASACPIRVAVAGNMTLEAGSGIFAENRRSGGNGGNIHLEVDGDLTLRGPDGSLPGAVVSTSRSTLVPGNAGSLTAVVGGTVELQAGSILAANSQTGNAGTVSVTGETVRVAGLVASGPSRTVLSTRFSGEALAGGIAGQTGGAIHLRALGSSSPGLQIETEGIVVSQGAGGGRLVLLEACGIEVRGLIASVSRNNGPSQVALRSGRGILVDGRDLGSEGPAEGRFGRIRADGIQLGAAGYLVDLFANSEIQVLGPASAATGLFAVTSNPGELPLRDAGGTITAISLAGGLTATGNAFAAGRDVLGNRGGTVDLRARDDVTLDDAVVRAVGGYSVLSVAGVGGHIDVRSFQGAVSWTFGRGDVRPTGSFVLPARRGTIEITACSTIDITGSQFPVNGGSVPPFPVEAEGVCSPAAPSLPEGEPPLPSCVPANQPPAPAGGPFSLAENSANGTVVGTVSANDPNPGQSHTFSILAGNTGGAFSIDNSGVITVASSGALDFETNPTFNLTVEVTDDGTPPLSGTTEVTINLTNAPEAPVATDEGSPASPYVEAVGNTILEVTASPTLDGAKIVFNGNVLTNDSDPDGPAAFTVTLESASAGAVVSLNSDGTFTYLPPPGFTGVDSFTYRITDPDGLSDTATVYINVEYRVWYVKNDAAADGQGRSAEPFDTLAEAESASSEGDTIYLFAGDGTTLGQSDGITLKSGQRLIGEAVQLTIPEAVNINGVDGPTLRAATANRPKIENDETPDAPGADNGVSVPATTGSLVEIEIRGLDISGFDNAIGVTAAGAHQAEVTIRDNRISGASQGVNLLGTGTAQATLDVTNVTFEGNRTSGVVASLMDAGSFDVSVSGSIFRDNGAAVTLQTGSSVDLNFDILNNIEIVGSTSNAIQLVADSSSTSSSQIRGTISGNVVGNGTVDSGSRDLFGIAIDLRGDQDSIIAVNGNNVQNSDREGIWVSSADFGALAGPSARLDLTLRDNTVGAPDDNSGFPLGFIHGVLIDGRNATTVCLDSFSNTSAGVGGGEHFRARQRNTSTFFIERLSDGDATPGEVINSVSTVEAHLAAENDPGSTADVTLVSGFIEAENGFCRSPEEVE